MKLTIKANRFKIFIVILIIISLSLTECFETATVTEDKSNNANSINISEGIMKHGKNKVKNKGPSNQAVPVSKVGNAIVNKVPTQDVGQTSNTKSTDTKLLKTGTLGDIDLGDGPIFHTSWIKYFKFSENDQNGDFPKHFFKNNQYYEQMKLFPKANLDETSSDGVNSNIRTYIKSPSDFFAVVFKNNVNIVSSRHTKLQKTFDVLNIEGIRPVEETRGFGENNDNRNSDSQVNNNGIQDFGNFNEGFCFKILNTKPKVETWVICVDTEEEKNKFMLVLKKLKIMLQRDHGVIMAPGMMKKEETLSSLLAPSGGNSNGSISQGNCDAKKNTGKKEDGYWIVMQDWTQCSLKCGGGISTLQRLCVPPKNGGSPCEGEAVLTRKCNTQPCPESNLASQTCNNNTLVMKPVVKVMPFSSRPQRYSKCIIKESDLMLTQNNENSQTQNNPLLKAPGSNIPKLQIPVRVVMNNRTISIFSGEAYDSQVLTFSLKESSFGRSIINKNCFIISEQSKKAELCPFGFNTDGKSIIEEWDYDFNLFKYQCFKPREKVDVNHQSLDADLKKKLQDKINKAKKELLEEREKQIKRNVEKEEENQIESVIKKTNQVALQALQKELNLEAMIRREEAEKEKKEEIEMMKRIEEEKKKSDCLLKAIRERQLENQYNVREKEAEEEINSIKKTANEQVESRRNKLKLQIREMRKKADRRRAALAQQLHTVRMSMADTMGKVYKKGDGMRCQTAMQSQNNKNIYCQANFSDDYSELTECKDTEDFCMFCCDHEFGEMFMNERHNCYKTYCPQNNPGENISGGTNGRWIWQSELK